MSDAALFQQLASHRRQQVVVPVQRMDTFTGELALHHERDKHLLPHETETGSLRRLVVDEKLHANIEPLADAPGPPGRLPQGMQGIAGLMKALRSLI
jgi:hypothetical protein